jgi:GIY-YIG catalytic domain.
LIPDIIKVQCYDVKVSDEDKLPIEISNIKELFKIPSSLYNSGTCIYFLCNKNQVVYVGQSENVHQRLLQHIKDKEFDSVFYLRVPANKMDKYEKSLIIHLKPKYNKTFAKMNVKNSSLAESILNEL